MNRTQKPYSQDPKGPSRYHDLWLPKDMNKTLGCLNAKSIQHGREGATPLHWSSPGTWASTAGPTSQPLGAPIAQMVPAPELLV